MPDEVKRLKNGKHMFFTQAMYLYTDLYNLYKHQETLYGEEQLSIFKIVMYAFLYDAAITNEEVIGILTKYTDLLEEEENFGWVVSRYAKLIIETSVDKTNPNDSNTWTLNLVTTPFAD